MDRLEDFEHDICGIQCIERIRCPYCFIQNKAISMARLHIRKTWNLMHQRYTIPS